MLEHPAISNALLTGYPSGHEPEPPLCFICGGECESMYRSRDTRAILGCNLCIEEYDPLMED